MFNFSRKKSNKKEDIAKSESKPAKKSEEKDEKNKAVGEQPRAQSGEKDRKQAFSFNDKGFSNTASDNINPLEKKGEVPKDGSLKESATQEDSKKNVSKTEEGDVSFEVPDFAEDEIDLTEDLEEDVGLDDEKKPSVPIDEKVVGGSEFNEESKGFEEDKGESKEEDQVEDLPEFDDVKKDEGNEVEEHPEVKYIPKEEFKQAIIKVMDSSQEIDLAIKTHKNFNSIEQDFKKASFDVKKDLSKLKELVVDIDKKVFS